MKQLLTDAALAAALTQPALATTFPSLTTIYIGSAAYDDGSVDNLGTATAIFCSNVSGLTANVRVLLLNSAGTVVGQQTFNGVLHGSSLIAATHGTAPLFETDLNTGGFTGVVNIESTQSGVFCTAIIMDAQGPVEDAVPLRLVRINGHPGAEE